MLNALLDHPFFTEPAPKTTGPELFNLDYVEQARQNANLPDIDPADLMATLTAFTAQAIVNFIDIHFSLSQLNLFVSGGGARNPMILANLAKALPQAAIDNTDALGINPDAKEAILFALLGNEAIAGKPLEIGNNPAVLMGKISFPA